MSDKTAKDWEDRVVLLEQENAQAKARETAMAKDLAEAKAHAAALSAGLESAKAAEKARRERDVADYIDGLQAKATASGNAISGPDLAKVRALFERGDDENAKFVGGLLLGKATAGAAPGKVVPLGPSGPGVPGDRAKAETAYAAEQLRALGWTVELSADGSAITKKTPPAAVRAGKA